VVDPREGLKNETSEATFGLFLDPYAEPVLSIEYATSFRSF
jgi:hypothetical protein